MNLSNLINDALANGSFSTLVAYVKENPEESKKHIDKYYNNFTEPYKEILNIIQHLFIMDLKRKHYLY